MIWSFSQYLKFCEESQQRQVSVWDSQAGLQGANTTMWLPTAVPTPSKSSSATNGGMNFYDKHEQWQKWMYSLQHHLHQQIAKGVSPIKFTLPQGTTPEQTQQTIQVAQQAMHQYNYKDAKVAIQGNELVINYQVSFHAKIAQQGDLRHLSPKKVDDLIRQSVHQALERRKNFPLAGSLFIDIPQPGYSHIDFGYFEKRIEFFLRSEFRDHKGMPFEHDDLEVHRMVSSKPGIMQFQVTGMEKNWQDRMYDHLPDEPNVELDMSDD